MTRNLNCDDLMPWFALVSEGELVGTGFQTIGRKNKPKKARNWFDDLPGVEKSTRVGIHTKIYFYYFFISEVRLGRAWLKLLNVLTFDNRVSYLE